MMQVKNVAEWLEFSAKQFPDKVAFSDGRNSMTFSQLRSSARRIGSAMARQGLFKKPVLIAMGKEPRAIAAFLGAAYSGNFYVPLDLEMPQERVDKIIEKLHPAITITNDNYDEYAESECDEKLLSRAVESQIDTDLLYVLFTSGSTGIPKGVAVQHRGVIDYTEKIQRTFGFDENSVHGQAVPLFFDSSILPLYQTLLCGGSDYLIPKKSLMFAAKTVDFLNEHKCNTIYWTPTSYGIIAKSGIFDKRIPQYLTKCLFVGEVMPNSVLNIWRRALPEAMYANLMGPTECTDTYLFYKVDREFADDEPLPVGRAYDNVEAMILNDQDRLCAVGEIGELCVRGSKVACGYYNDSERTAAVFVQNPLNSAYPEIIYRTGDMGFINERGEIMYAGRKDFQIKHSGHRIELGEIETIAGTVAGVELCACVYDDLLKRIVLFFCGTAEADEVKTQLKRKLQPYMVPGMVEKIPEMPQTATGKVDRITLKNSL